MPFHLGTVQNNPEKKYGHGYSTFLKPVISKANADSTVILLILSILTIDLPYLKGIEYLEIIVICIKCLNSCSSKFNLY